MFEQTSEAHGNQEKSLSATPFTPARVYLSRDGRYLLHALPDGRIVGRHVNYYRQVLRRAGGRSQWASIFETPSARLTMTIVTWVVRLLMVAWMALHPAMHLPSAAAPASPVAPAE